MKSQEKSNSSFRQNSRKATFVALTAVLSGFASSSVMATNGYFTHGYGMTHKGMAGAGIAISNDVMSAANNPAALSVEGTQLSAGVDLFSPSREYRVSDVEFFAEGGFYLPGTGQKSENDYFLIPEFAFGYDLNDGWNVGLTVYANGGMNTEYAVSEPNPGTFYAGTTGVDLKQLFVSPTASYQVSENTRVGFAPVFVVQQFEATGVASFAGFSSDPTSVSNNGTDTSTGVGYHVGIQHQVNANLDLGVSYRSSVSMSEFDKYGGLFAEQGGFDLPSSYQIGAAYQINPQHQLMLDWQRINYSEVASVANPMSNIMVAPLGADNGAGFGWQDMKIVKLGYQWQRTAEQTLRAGLSYGEQPIPNSEVLFNILAPGVQEWHVTAGLTQHLSDDVAVNVAGFYSPEKTVSGANFLAPNQQVELSMSQFGFGASITWQL